MDRVDSSNMSDSNMVDSSVDSRDHVVVVDTGVDSVDRVDRVDNMANSMVDQYRVGLRFSLSLTLAVHEVIVVIGMSIDSSHMMDSRNMSHMANTSVVDQLGVSLSLSLTLAVHEVIVVMDSRDSVVVVDRVDRV